jgi:hypothetical protein
MTCAICGSCQTKLIMFDNGQLVTSLGKLVEGHSTIYSCESCSHCQTESTIDFEKYYSSEYKTLMAFPDEDDIYSIVNGKIIYRSDHMVEIFMTKILKYRSDLQANECIRLLDFGCGKGHFANKLSSLSSLFKCYLYDVSTDYVPSWSEHVSSSRYACFNIPDSWLGAFDVITSLFSLEHVQDPIEELKKFKLLLSFQGFAYIVVPNMYSENRMDMLVADHIHHYSPLSMRKALQKAGLELVEEDHVSHSQSSIYIAKNCPERSRPVHNPNITDKYLQMQKDLAMSFQSSFDMLDSFLESKRGRPIAIVGAGVIGSLISSLIDNRMQIACFVDSSEFKQKKGWLSTRVISPLDLDKLSTVPPPVYIIAFNPKMAPIGLSMVPKSVQSSDVFSLFSPQ